jgi:hypothetical protein
LVKLRFTNAQSMRTTRCGGRHPTPDLLRGSGGWAENRFRTAGGSDIFSGVMEPHTTLAAAQTLLGITLLAFLPLVVATLVRPLRDARGGRR